MMKKSNQNEAAAFEFQYEWWNLQRCHTFDSRDTIKCLQSETITFLRATRLLATFVLLHRSLATLSSALLHSLHSFAPFTGSLIYFAHSFVGQSNSCVHAINAFNGNKRVFHLHQKHALCHSKFANRSPTFAILIDIDDLILSRVHNGLLMG